MNTTFQDIEQIYNAPQDVLEKLIHEHPAVAIYRAILLKKLKDENSYTYHDALKNAALHVPDRKHLYHFLNKKEETEISELVLENETIETTSPIEEAVNEVSKIDTSTESKVTEEIKEKETLIESNNEELEISNSTLLEEEIIDFDDIKDVEDSIKEPFDENPLESNNEIKEEIGLKTEDEAEEHTFEDWLNFLEDHNIDDKEDELASEIDIHHAAASYEQELAEEIKEVEENNDVSEQLTVSEEKKVNTLASDSITLKTGAVTETLAKIMLMQGKINEAITMYQQLCLKYPEKSNYFAAQIEKIKNK